MTKASKTKRALLASVLSLVLCVSMLVGSTYAWFTDSVTSANNIIKAGNLDVEMYWAEGSKPVPADGSNEWKDASEGAIFDYDLWEPGYVSVRHIKIANVGTLALKYQFNIFANGEVSKLADVIDVYYVDPAVQVVDRTMLTEDNKLGNLTKVLSEISTSASGELEANTSDTVTLALKMRETAGNEYQNLSIGSDFFVQLMATQFTSESDSFDDQYDVQATYLNKDADGAWLINNMDELYFLAQQVNSGNSYTGETFKLTADIDLAGYNWIPIGAGAVGDKWIGFNGSFDGQGHTISNVKVTKSGGWNGLFGLVGRGTPKYTESISNLTVKNVTIPEANRMSGGLVGQMYGNIENCHVENVTIFGTPNWEGTKYNNGDKIGGLVGWHGDNNNYHYIRGCTAKNVTLHAYRDVGGIAGYIGQSCIVEKCAVDTVAITVDQLTHFYGVEKINAGAVVGRIYKEPVTIQNNTEANVTIDTTRTISEGAIVVQTADQLVAAFANLKANDTIYILNDIDMTGKTITPVTGNKAFTMLGNGNTIRNLNTTERALFVAHSGSSKYVFDSVNLENCSVNSTTNYGALFVGDGDTSDEITITNCHVKNCTVKSAKYAAAFIGYTAGWNKEGPVYSDVTIKDCSVTGGSVTGGGSVGAAIGHAGGNPDTTSTITNLTVKDVALNGEDAEHTGIAVGTAHVGKTVINNVTYSGVTGNYNTAKVLYGRYMPGTTGSLTIDGATVLAAATTQALKDAITAGNASVYLPAGDYTMPNTSEDVTISGTKDVNVTLPFKAVYGSNGNTITFEGVTIKGETDGSLYSELFNGAKKVVYKDCVIYDQLTTYADSEFIGCTFYNTFDNDYSVYCYSGKNMLFDGCTFNTECGKAIKVYDEGNGGRTVTVNGCTFNATNYKKAAVEIDSTNSTYYVYINGGTLEGAFTAFWNSDAGEDANANVCVNGTWVKGSAPNA